MSLFISILSGIFILFGVGLFFAPTRGALLAGFICIGSGLFAYEEMSLMPLGIGFGLLWVLRLIGAEGL